MTAPLQAEGLVNFTIWPVYVGFANDQGEPHGPDYRRGQIFYEHRDGRIEGHARVHPPAGEYTHQVVFYSPTDPLPTAGSIPLPHPLRFPASGWSTSTPSPFSH